MSKDMLKEIFRLQEKFDQAVVEHRGGLEFPREVWIQKEILALISELAEVLDEVNFKWWKDPKEIDSERLKEEIVDVLHFFSSACVSRPVSALRSCTGLMWQRTGGKLCPSAGPDRAGRLCLEEIDKYAIIKLAPRPGRCPKGECSFVHARSFFHPSFQFGPEFCGRGR